MAQPQYDEAWMERDYYGYGMNPPDMQWPKGAKIAVNFVLNQEEGGERSVPDGDEHAETVLHEFGTVLSVVPGVRDPAVESQFDYGARSGVWRIMRLFKQHDIPCTFYAVARAFEKCPELAKYAAENHEIASHCYKWMSYANMTEQEEEEYIRKALFSFKETCGRYPVGWYYGRPSARSCSLVAKVHRELKTPFKYWADTYADDKPFWRPQPDEHDKGLVMMPYSLDCNDFKLWLTGMPVHDWEKHIIDAFTTLREEGQDGNTSYLTIALHSRWIGRPGRFQALKRIVEHIAQFDDVWFATREQIANHFAEKFPYEPKK